MRTEQAGLALNWALSSSWLRSAGRWTGPRGQPEIGSPRYLTTVVRLPAEIAERLAETASRLAGPRAAHYLYPSRTIHLTAMSLADVPEPEPLVEAALARHRCFAIEVGGLNVSLDSVFAELHPRGPELEALRHDLRECESGEHGAVSRWLRRRLAHANLIRFAGPVEPRLLSEVRRLRRARFGSFEVTEVELARTDKVLSDAGTLPLATFPLA